MSEVPGSWEATALATYVTIDQASQVSSSALVTALALLAEENSVEALEILADVIAGLLFHAEAKGRATGLASEPVDGVLGLPAIPAKPYQRPGADWQQGESKPLRVIDLDEDHLDGIRDRIGKALETIHEDDADPTERIIRLVENETAASMQMGLQAGMVESGKATGYRRGVNPDCCRICFYAWSAGPGGGGYVYPINQKMWRHTGCRCVPIPTTDPVGSRGGDDEALTDQLLERYYSDTIESTALNHRPAKKNEGEA